MKTDKHSLAGLGKSGKRLALAFVLAGLFLIACIFALDVPGEADLRPEPASLHIVQAQILEQPSLGFTAASSEIAALPAGAWSAVNLPHAVPLGLLPAALAPVTGATPTAVTWYRLDVPPDMLPDQAASRYIYIPRWKTLGRIAVYGGRRLLFQSHSNQLSLGSNHPLLIPWDADAHAARPDSILIRIEHLPGVDGALSSVWVGDDESLGWRFTAREWLQSELPLLSSAAFVVIGVFAVFVWSRRRHETLYLVFAAMSVASYIRTLLYSAGPDRLLISDVWFTWLTSCARIWLIALAHLFLVQLHRRVQPWLTRAVFGLALIVTVFNLPFFTVEKPDIGVPLINLALLLASLLAFGMGLWNSWQRHAHYGAMLAGWGLFSTVLGVHDWLLEKNLINIESGFFASYANLGLFVLFTYVIYSRYADAIDEVEALNAGLEQRLQVRETELGASYQRLRQVEQSEMLSQERRRLMQDMHDGLGATLISALRVVESGKVSAAEIADMLKSCVEDLKLSIDSMEPVEADLLLLLATLRFRIGPRLKSMGIELRWEIQDVPPLDWLDPRNSLHILRILQEAFTNIIKHTHASEIRVATAAQDTGVAVTITDNGQGFVFERAMRQGGRGLSNQLRRVEAIGGKVRWDSSERGTCFHLWLPERRAGAPACPGE